MSSKNKVTQLAIEASPKQQARGIGYTEVNVPSRWLLPAADAKEAFTPAVDHALVERYRAEYPTVQFLKVLPAVPGFMGGILLAGLTNNFLLDLTGYGIMLTMACGGIFAAMRSEAKGDRLHAALSRYADRALNDWLLARYNLKIAHVFSKPHDFLLRHQSQGANMTFADEQGRSFKLVQGAGGLYVEELREQGYAPSGALSARDAEAELASLLTGEAQALHERTAELLAALKNRALSAEGQHVVKRVQEDLRQTLVINRELQEVGGADDGSRAELAAVLSALNDELDEVLAGERQGVRDMLSTQLGYVKGRRRHISALQLPAAEQPISKAPQVAVRE